MDNSIRAALVKGLTSGPMYLPTWYRYDKEGSRLNDICIEKCKWYYFHRSETDLLQNTVESITTSMKKPAVLVDLGSGNAIKTRLFIDKIISTSDSLIYIPVDISREYLNETAKQIEDEYDDRLIVQPIAAAYLEALKTIRKYDESKLFLMFGGSIQNLPYKDQIRYLSEISKTMTGNDTFLLTMDTTDTSEKRLIELAYLDPEGYSAEFHFNSIHRLNREMGGDIDVSKFSIKSDLKVVTSRQGCSYVRVWIESQSDCSFQIRNLSLSLMFKKDDKLFLHDGEGISCKYTSDQIKHLCELASLEIKSSWTNKHVTVMLLSRKIENGNAFYNKNLIPTFLCWHVQSLD